MRVAKIATAYGDYVRGLYASKEGLAGKDYSQQKASIEYDAFGWADFWGQALGKIGVETLEVTANAELLQRAWAREHLGAGGDRMALWDIAVAQVEAFRPDVLWFEDVCVPIVERLCTGSHRPRLVVGWAGSAIPRTDAWGRMDLVLSCAQESVEHFRARGLRAEQIHHAFDPRVNQRLVDRPKTIGCSFVGQLLLAGAFHVERARLLLRILSKVPVRICCPNGGGGFLNLAQETARDVVRAGLRAGGTLSGTALKGGAKRQGQRLGLAERFRLRRGMEAGVFGLSMFQTLRDSKATINVHADSSPAHASNMRLFEATGVGTCLVTDWRANLCELFEPDAEVVTFRTAEECAEKVLWLLEHDREREEIAARGQARTLRDHTFDARAEVLERRLRKRL